MEYVHQSSSNNLKFLTFSRWLIGFAAGFSLLEGVWSAYVVGNGSIIQEPAFQTCLLFAILGYVQDIYYTLKAKNKAKT